MIVRISLSGREDSIVDISLFVRRIRMGVERWSYKHGKIVEKIHRTVV